MCHNTPISIAPIVHRVPYTIFLVMRGQYLVIASSLPLIIIGFVGVSARLLSAMPYWRLWGRYLAIRTVIGDKTEQSNTAMHTIYTLMARPWLSRLFQLVSGGRTQSRSSDVTQHWTCADWHRLCYKMSCLDACWSSLVSFSLSSGSLY
jgi:hypothetical protein